MERTRKIGTRTVAIAAVLAIAGAGATAAVGQGADKVKSKVKLTEGGPDAIEGKVTSEEAKCERKRKATLYMHAPGSGGDDRVEVATDRSDRNGNLLFRPEGQPVFTAGEYFAVVRKLIDAALICQAATSRRVAF
jgi:hypothetical protein